MLNWIRFIGLLERYLKFIRYLIAGAYNTLFGFGVFAILYILLAEHINYLIIAVISQILAITNAFLVYKFWVFKSGGSLLAEYARTYVVYGISFVVSLAGLSILVEMAHLHPIIGTAVMAGITVLISYVGHSRYSFAPTPSLATLSNEDPAERTP